MELEKTADGEQLTDQTAIVGYWAAIGRYTLNFSRPGTMDAQITLVVDELPKDFQKQGLSVVFSGRYFRNPDLPAPMLGGQEIYQVELSGIR